MGEFWTLEGMYSGKKNNGKDSKQKKLEKKEKEKKKKKKNHDDNQKGSAKHSKKNEINIFEGDPVTYGNFLKSNAEGLFKVKTEIEGEKVSTYIIKSSDTTFPKVALESTDTDYKDWLKEKIESMDCDENINKILYNSKVVKVKLPNDLLAKIIRASI